MKCLVCKHGTNFYFKKKFTNQDIKFFLDGLVEYYICEYCGFAFSKTHYLMSQIVWQKLNAYYHIRTKNPTYKELEHPPPYYEQSVMIHILGKNHILNTEDIIDWRGGFGTLSKITKKYFNINIPVFEKYIRDPLSEVHFLQIRA